MPVPHKAKSLKTPKFEDGLKKPPSHETLHPISSHHVDDSSSSFHRDLKSESETRTHASHHNNKHHKASYNDAEYQTAHDKVLHPIYEIKAPVKPNHEAQLHTTDADTKTHYKNEDPLTLYHVGKLSLSPHHGFKSVASSHHELQPSRSEVFDLSTPMPIAFAEKNALYDPSSNVLYYTGDESVRPRIICLTDQRDNMELLRSLKDDITKLKQKFSCD
jgi:hypothetical protein